MSKENTMDDSTTFADLGIPFPLFEAPVRLASSYEGVGHCDVCGEDGSHVFRLGIGHDVIHPCPACSTPVIFDADDAADLQCSCGANAPFPFTKKRGLHTCYGCLRGGRVAMTQDTEFGMVRYEDAVNGITHGVPGLEATGYQTEPSTEDEDDDEEWVKVRISSEHLLELVRTPSYVSWQGERWQFCCGQPMTYIGEWQEADFSNHASDGDGKALFDQLGKDGGLEYLTWDELCNEFHGVIYAFNCKACGSKKVHWDCD
jgi:uncharacterized protein CbrC (UPF0167 family)